MKYSVKNLIAIIAVLVVGGYCLPQTAAATNEAARGVEPAPSDVIEAVDILPPPPPPAPPMPPPLRRFFEDLRQRDPQEYQRLVDLRARDPAAFREEMMERLRRKKGKHGPNGGPRLERRHRHHLRDAADPMHPHPIAPPHHAELAATETKAVELAKRWKEEKNPTAKSAIERDLRAALERAFEIRQQLRKVWLAELRERVAELEATIEFREKNRDVIIERRFRELTQ